MPDSPFPGYQSFQPTDPYEEHVGPMYYRRETGAAHGLLPVQPHHLNSGGMVHGGLLMTFADYALALAAGSISGSFSLTVGLNCQFLNAGRLGSPLEATAEVIRTGKSLAFARGLILQDGVPLLSASGVFKPIERGKTVERAAARPPPAPSAWAEPPDGFRLVERASPFLKHVGDTFVGEKAGRRTIVQPTRPHMLNTGAIVHGGMLMNFADNAFCTEIALATGKAPITTAFAAEFIASGRCGPLLESAVETLRTTGSTAFVRGTVTQENATLLTYSGVISLRDMAALKERMK